MKWRFSFSNNKRIAIADQAVVSASNFLISVFLARTLGLEGFGFYSFLWLSLMAVSTIYHALVISPLMVLGHDLVSQPSYRSASFLVSIVCTIFLTGALLIILYITELGGSLLGRLDYRGYELVLLAVVFLNQDFLRRCCYAENQPKGALVIDLFTYAPIVLSLTVFMLIGTATVTQAVLVLTSGYLIGFVYGVLKIRFEFISGNFLRVYVKRTWRSSIWLLPSSLLVWVSGNLYLLAAGEVLSISAVGIVRACQSINGVFLVSLQVLENIMPVKLVGIYRSKGLAALQGYSKKIAVQLIGVCLALSIPVCFFSDFLLFYVYGEKYSGYGNIVIILFFSNMVVIASMFVRFILRVLEQTKPIFIGYVVSSILAILTLIPVLKTFDVTGVAIGITLTQIVFLVTSYYGLKKYKL